MGDTEKIIRRWCGYKNMDEELRKAIYHELRCNNCDGYGDVSVINIDENLEYINRTTERCRDYCNYEGRNK